MDRTAHQFSYAGAREALLTRAGSGLHTALWHPRVHGPDGAIAMDVITWNLERATHVLVVSSGTHGIEGYCGSFLQCALLDDGLAESLPPACGLLFVHGVNPYGFAWQRRVNEDNVDLNRNFVDHALPYPVNAGYQSIAELLEPETWEAAQAEVINGGLLAAMRRAGGDMRWLQAALSGGQYSHPFGQFFGGNRPTWSNETIMERVAGLLIGRRVTWIDIHTALGEFGTGQCIMMETGSDPAVTLARGLWGDRVAAMGTPDSVSVNVPGTLVEALKHRLGGDFLGTGLEFGTVPAMEVGLALIQDQWLHRHAVQDSDQRRQIKARMMAAFYPDSAAWRSQVFAIAREVVHASLNRT